MQEQDVFKHTGSAPAFTSRPNEVKELILARTPQGYKSNINLRFVPGRDFDLGAVILGCQPRKGAPRRDAEPLPLPLDLIDKLKNANRAVVAWLAQDEANARLFMARPVEALLKAGVDLTRADQKSIQRIYHEVKEAAVVAPGVEVAGLSVAAFPRGQVGKLKPGPRLPKQPDNNIGCVEED